MADDVTFGYKTRRNGLPEHISENIVKFVIHNKLNDTTCSWGCAVGDLYSKKSKIIECKSLTSDGPISFGPAQKWDEIYFLDARKWLNDELHIWKCSAPSTHEVWKTLKISKGQTKADQSAEHRRPRIGWNALYPQISAFCLEVYSGPFEGIFIPAPAKKPNEELESEAEPALKPKKSIKKHEPTPKVNNLAKKAAGGGSESDE